MMYLRLVKEMDSAYEHPAPYEVQKSDDQEDQLPRLQRGVGMSQPKTEPVALIRVGQ